MQKDRVLFALCLFIKVVGDRFVHIRLVLHINFLRLLLLCAVTILLIQFLLIILRLSVLKVFVKSALLNIVHYTKNPAIITLAQMLLIVVL